MSKKPEQLARREMRPFSMLAQVRSGSVDDQKRTFDVVWSTGADVIRTDWWSGEQYVERLSMKPEHVRLGRLNNGAPFLNAHNGYDLTAVMGVVEAGTARLESGQGVATVRASKREDVAPLISDIRDGIIQNVSVGYRVYKYEVTEEMGQMPVRTATDWEPYELSAVPMGADDGAGVRSQAVQTNPCEIVTRSNANQETNEMTPEQIAAQQADQKRIADERAAAEKQAAEKAQAVERERVTGIVQAVRTAKLDVAFGDKLVADGVSLDKAREMVINKLAEKDAEVKTDSRTGVEIVPGADEFDKFVRGASESILSRSAIAEPMKKAGHKLDAGEFRGMTLVDLARFCLDRAGVNTRGMDKMRMVGLAFTRGGYNGTSDFSVLLETTMNKSLLAGYAITPDTWSRFCARGTVSDFRAHNRYLMGTFGSLDSLNENGEYKRKNIADGQKQSITAATKGNIVAISRKAVINDDMDAFTRVPSLFGRAAKLSVEVDVYAALALNSNLGPDLSDGNPIFHDRTGIVNNITNSAALTVAALDVDRAAMKGFKDISGNEVLDLSPAILLVSSSLAGTARVLNDAQYDPDTSNKLQKPNMVRGLFRDIVDTARLSGNRRYIFADPNIAPVIEVAFLDGNSEPFMESQDGWNVDGTEMKVRLDYAVGGVGYHGALTNAGG